MRAQLRFFALRHLRTNGVEIGAVIDYPDGQRHAMVSPTFAPVRDDEIVDRAMLLDQVAAQSLMDELFAAGIRPTEGAGSVGQLAAVQRHLADMRAIVGSRLRVDLPKA